MSSPHLIHHIHQTIEASQGFLSFARFMTIALYHAELGYYNSKQLSFDKTGNFTTAPEISPLFAQCLARQCMQVAEKLETFNILELGAGSGKLACELLTNLNQHGYFPKHYFIYEPAPRLQHQQQRFLQTHPHSSCFHWVNEIPSHFVGIIIANEVLDALPVHLFYWDGNVIFERGLFSQHNQLVLGHQLAKPPLSNEITLLNKRVGLSYPYRSEINLGLFSFLKPVIENLEQGLALFFDYGYNEREYYHPERMNGTLTCFYQKHYHNDPLMLIGQQDITAHVNFTALAEYGTQLGAKLSGFTTQAAFLLANGLIDLAEKETKHLSLKDAFQVNQAIKQLTFPTEMGERVKVMAFSKKIASPLAGFQMQDRRHEL